MNATPIPPDATPKTLRRHSWDPTVTVTVYLQPTTSADTSTVWSAAGDQLGTITRYMSTIDTKIAGSRLVNRGKRREFWCANRRFWQKLESAAEAIRQLLPL